VNNTGKGLISIVICILSGMSLYLNKNPFIKDDSDRKKWDFYTQIFAIATKK